MSLTPTQAAVALKRVVDKLDDIGVSLRAEVRGILGGRATNEYMQRAPIGPRGETSGPLRIQTGRLARSVAGGRSAEFGDESIIKSEKVGRGIRFTWGSSVPYAKVHEEGFSGKVPVEAHTRTITQAFGETIPETTVQVKAHTRQMNMPARPYLKPALRDEADVVGRLVASRILQVVDESLST